MKNKTILPYLYILVLIGLLTSCNKYLDKKTDNTLVVPNTVEDLQALLDDATYMNNSTSTYMITVSDDYFATEDAYNSQDEINRNAYKWIPIEYNFPNDWSSAYTAIYNSNLCLEIIDGIAKTSNNSDKWNNVKGSALFYRSYYFLNLAWAFSKIYDQTTSQKELGIVLRLGSDFNIPTKRATINETYERIIADTKESISYLPDNPQHVMRPSKAAAYGLLARAYLSMSHYDSALKYSTLCLSLKNKLLDFNNSSQIDIYSDYPFEKFNLETVFYTESYSSGLYIQYNGLAFADTLLQSSYADDDLRKTAYFLENTGYHSFKGNYTNNDNFFSGIATDEMYLINAECYARLNMKDMALNNLNTLLSNRIEYSLYTPVTASTANDALNIILEERRKELLFRGLRWIDIKRLNKDGANIIPKRIIEGQTYSLPPNDKRYALPLPKDIIDRTGVTQN